MFFRRVVNPIRLMLWWIVNLFPDETFFNTMRPFVLRQLFGVKIGDGVLIFSGFYFKGNIEIGDNCAFNRNVGLSSSSPYKITLGDNVIIASNVVIRNANHGFDVPGQLIRLQKKSGGDIVIGSNVWIGSNAVILPGVTIGTGSVVGAGAVVTRSVDSFSVVGGVPARLIRRVENVDESMTSDGLGENGKLFDAPGKA